MSSLRIGGIDPSTHRVKFRTRTVGVSMLDVELFPANATGPAELTVRAYCHRILDDGAVVPESMGDYVLDAPYPEWLTQAVRAEVGSFIPSFGVPAGVVPDLSDREWLALSEASWRDLLSAALKEWEAAYRIYSLRAAQGVDFAEITQLYDRVTLLEKRVASLRRICEELRLIDLTDLMLIDD